MFGFLKIGLKLPSPFYRPVDRVFDSLVEKKGLREHKVARFLPVFGFSIEILLEILGIVLVYYIMSKLAPVIVGDNYNNNLLYSLVFIPIISTLKRLPDITKSLFVRIALSGDYIVCKRGFFQKFVDELYVRHIDNIEIRTTLWGEWFNYGNISLYSFGGKINLPFLKDPDRIYVILKHKIERRKKKI